MENVVEYNKKCFQPLSVDQQNMMLLGKMIQEKIKTELEGNPEAPITEEELRTAVTQGPLGKSPGEDGICHEFYLAFLDIIKSDLL
jgi:hypothetical protein